METWCLCLPACIRVIPVHIGGREPEVAQRDPSDHGQEPGERGGEFLYSWGNPRDRSKCAVSSPYSVYRSSPLSVQGGSDRSSRDDCFRLNNMGSRGLSPPPPLLLDSLLMGRLLGSNTLLPPSPLGRWEIRGEWDTRGLQDYKRGIKLFKLF